MAIPIEDSLNRINWESLLQNSYSQIGGNLIGFRGLKYQRGHGIGSFFSSLFRLVAPAAKKIIKTVGKEGAKAGLELGSDLLAGKDVKESV